MMIFFFIQVQNFTLDLLSVELIFFLIVKLCMETSSSQSIKYGTRSQMTLKLNFCRNQ